MSARGYATKFDLLPRPGLVFKALVKDDLVDTIGESSIELTTGIVDDLANASWAMPSDAVTIQADSDMGGDVFFDSANAMAPIVRFGYQWYALLNNDFAWIGFHQSRGGIVIYSADKSAQANRIQDYLGRYAPDATFVVDGGDFVVDGSDFITDGV